MNLVRVFVAIYETRSLTLTAERLFVTQSAVSQSLARMREQFDDPLFERTGRGMRPTPLADAVFPVFQESLAGIDRTIDSVHGFDAASSERTFRIALSELGEIGWLPAIFAAVHGRAPRARLEVLPVVVADLPELLSRGSVDLAVTPADLPGRFDRRHIKGQTYGVALSSRNPLARGDLTLDDYRAAARVAVAGDSGAHLLDAAHRRVGGVSEPALTVGHFATLPLLLTRSDDLIATIPTTIAEGWAASWPLIIRELPIAMAPIELNLYRRNSTQHTGALNWFYDTVSRAIEGSAAGDFDAIHAGARKVRRR